MTIRLPIVAALLALVSAVPGPAHAAAADQSIYANWIEPGPPPVERFVKPLGLSADQQKKLRPIFEEARAKAAADAKSRSDTADAQQVGGLLSQREADFRIRLATVLTPEQMAQYEALSAAHAPSTRTLIPHPAHGHSEGSMEAPSADSSVEPKGR